MEAVFIRAMWNYDRDEASLAAGLDCLADPDDLPVTQQQYKDECDINEIVRRFGLTGGMPQDPRPPMVGDFTGITDFKSAMDAVILANERFMEFPAEIRERFRNDPQHLLEFVADEKNRDEALSIGLIPKPPEKTRDVVTAVDELAAKFNVTPVKP